MRLRFSVLSRLTTLCLGLSLSWLAPPERLRAEVVISTFEDSSVSDSQGNPVAPNITNQSFAGRPYDVVQDANVPSNIRSGNVTFLNDGLSVYGSWSGVGYSQKSAVTPNADNSVTYYQYSNDFVPTTSSGPSGGAGGSATWGVIYELGSLAADPGYIFQSLAITNTLWTWDTMANGDPFAGPAFSEAVIGPGGKPADFFTVRFTNTDDTSKVLDFNLADFRGNLNDRGETDYIIHDWTEVNLSGLSASHLNVSFLGSRESQYGLLTPAYAAIDNVTVTSVAAVPEPSSMALLVAGSSVGIWCQWRKRRRSGEANTK